MNDAESFENDRLIFCERIQLRSEPLRAYINQLARVGGEWQAYAAIVRADGFLPVYLRRADELRQNFALANDDLPADESLVCFLRKLRREPDGSIAMDIHLVDEPPQLERLFHHAAMMNLERPGEVSFLVSGSALLAGNARDSEPWIEASRGMPMSILMYVHPREIMGLLNQQWDALVWHIQILPEADLQRVLFVFPIGVNPVPEVGLFRPVNRANADAAVRLLDPPAIAVTRGGAWLRILGPHPELAGRQWPFPTHLEFVAGRYLNQEFTFSANA